MLSSKQSKLAIIVAIVIILAVGIYAGVYFAGQQTPSQQPLPNTTIIVGSTEYPALGISPYNASLDTAFNIAHQIYEGLVTEKLDGTVVPQLATRWSPNRDASSWTFILRQGVKFHDGTQFNATAVKMSIELSLPTNLGKLLITPYIKSVVVLNESAVNFVLNTPFGGFPAVLATASGLIASPSAYYKNSHTYGTFVNIGTGPFKFVQWIPNDRVILERNTGYWDASRIPKAQTFIWKFFTDANAMVLSLQSGSINAIYQQMPKAQIASLAQNPQLSYLKNLDAFTYFLGLNYRFKPLDNVLFRRAIAYAIDYDRIIKIENATRAYSIYPTQMFGDLNVNPQKNFTYNPTYAKQLLAKAGYPNGYNGTLDLYYPTLSFGPEMGDVVTIIQKNLGDIGIKVNLQARDAAAQNQVVNSGSAPMSIFRAQPASGPEPDQLATFDYGLNQVNSYYRWGFNNKTADDIVVRARTSASPSERLALYQQLQNTFDTQPSHLIYLYNNVHYVFFQKTVKGLNALGVVGGLEVDWTQVYVAG